MTLKEQLEIQALYDGVVAKPEKKMDAKPKGTLWPVEGEPKKRGRPRKAT